MIYFQAIAGLCNRILGIKSAVSFAEENNQPLVIVWENQSDCNCDPRKLFKIKSCSLKKIIVLPYVDIGIRAEVRKRVNNFRINSLKRKCDVVEINEDFYKNKDELIAKAKSNTLYLSSYSHWWGADDDFESVVFNSELNIIAENNRRRCGEKCCGVHIRRTDHDICIENSPTDIFIENMKNEPEDVNFYVATDDLKEINNLKRVFGSKRIFYKKDIVLNRDEERGIFQAAEELLTLSKMDKIYGSYGSTFSKTAADIGKKELLFCKIREMEV